MQNYQGTSWDWFATDRRLVCDHTSSGKIVEMVAGLKTKSLAKRSLRGSKLFGRALRDCSYLKEDGSKFFSIEVVPILKKSSPHFEMGYN